MSMVGEVSSQIGNKVGGMMDTLSMNQLSKDSFLKLLLAQLKLQSPTSPFDSNTMMQQISQLTNLNATEGLEHSVNALNTQLGTSQVLQASSLIGKKVQIPSDKGFLAPETGLQGSVMVPEGVKTVEITIRDANNTMVKTIPLSNQGAGQWDYSWDGLDAEQKPMSPGVYQVSASAVIDGNTTSLPTAGIFTVDSVANDEKGQGVLVDVSGIGRVGLNRILKIM